jgi:hypothetical protein
MRAKSNLLQWTGTIQHLAKSKNEHDARLKLRTLIPSLVKRITIDPIKAQKQNQKNKAQVTIELKTGEVIKSHTYHIGMNATDVRNPLGVSPFAVAQWPEQ